VAAGSITACGEIFGIESEKKRNVNREANHGDRFSLTLGVSFFI